MQAESRFVARLSDAPNAAAMANIEKNSNETSTYWDTVRRSSFIDKVVKVLAKNTKEA